MKGLSSMGKIFTALLTAFIVLAMANTASAAPLEVPQNQKEAFYKQYAKIVEEVNAEYPEANLELAPLNEFGESDWVKPKEFKQLAIDRVGLTFVEEPTFSTMAVSSTKSKSFTSNGAAASVNITGTFTTAYDSYAKRQYFSNVTKVTSSTAKGTWVQGIYTATKLDGGRTFQLIVAGKYTLNGLSTNHNLTVYFYCSPTGGVS